MFNIFSDIFRPFSEEVSHILKHILYVYIYILLFLKTNQAQKRKRAGTGKHCDYLDKREYGPVKRRRTDPVISFSSFLENLLTELRLVLRGRKITAVNII